MCRVDCFEGGLVILVTLRKEHRQLDIAFFPSRTMGTWDDQSLDHDASRRGLSPNNWVDSGKICNNFGTIGGIE